MKKRLVYGTILTAVLVGLCMAAPKPAILQKPGQWTMEVKFVHPQQIVVPWGANGQSRFWYMILTVTNRTGRDVEFYPKCDLMTDTFQVLPAGQGVPPIVFQYIQQRHGGTYQFLEPLERVESRLLQGEDNAKDIVIAWQDFDPQAAGFKVFVSGLSNETAVVRHPVALDPDSGQPAKVFLRKTLELNYSLQGDPTIRPSVQTVYTGQDWVMR
jgi:hypothetical protein